MDRRIRNKRIAWALTGAALAGGNVTGAQAQSLGDALLAGTPLADIRYRYEYIEQSNKSKTANASTVRARLGYQTGAYAGFQGLAELDLVQHLGSESYNDTLNGRVAYPAIPEPDLVSLNRLQLGYAFSTSGAATPDVRFAIGRQRIAYGDARFIGNAGWRQHEQTYDAISFSGSFISDASVNYAYVTRVNRIFGPKSQNADFDSDSHFVEATYSGVPHTKIEAYTYLLNLRQAPVLSTASYGARAEFNYGIAQNLTGVANAAIARQNDYGRNPLNIGLSYFLTEAGLTFKNFMTFAGYEVLQGNGTASFQTPLASLHLFQGFAETFVNGAPNGVKDFYLKANYAILAPPVFNRISGAIVYHDFSVERLDLHYGHEWDAQLEAQVSANVVVDLAFAAYSSDGPFPTKHGVWFYTTYRY